MDNLLFFAPYSEENLVLAESLNEKVKKIYLWKTKLLETKGENYSLFDDDFSDEFYEKVMIINRIPQEIQFFSEIISAIKDFGFSPEAIIVKGCTTDILPFAMIKEEYGIDYPLIAILDDIGNTLLDFEKFALEQFDEIITFVNKNRFPKIDKDNVNFLFNFFDASKFKSLTELGIYKEVKNSKLIICDDDNVYKSIEGKYSNDDNISIINANICDMRDIVVYANLSEIVIDATDSNELYKVIKKIGKSSIQLKEFDKENFNSIEMGNVVYPYSVKNLKDFCSEIKKDIQKVLEKYSNKRNIVVGEDIRI